MLQRRMEEGLALHRAGRLGEAELAYREVLSGNPNHADALHLLGVIAFQARQYLRAIDYIGKAIAANPGAPDFHVNLAHAQRDNGDAAGAESSYRRSLSLRPGSPDVLNHLGLLYLQQGRLVEAASEFERALAVAPNHLNAWMNLGNTRNAQGDSTGAEQCFRKALALSPGFAEGYNNLGALLHARGDFAAARAAYETALRLKPGYADAQCNLGATLEAQGDDDGAIRNYNECIKSGMLAARINLGALLQRRKQYAEASAQYHAALAADSLQPQAHINLGAIAQLEGRNDDALAHYVVARAQLPMTAELANNLGTASQGLGRLDRTLALLRQGMAAHPQDAQALSNIGSALFLMNRNEEALAQFRAAAAIDPQNLEANWNISQALLAMGRFEEGWQFAAWRVAREHKTFGRPPRPHEHPMWNGEPLAGKVLLIYPESGVGDEIWFAGMFAEVLERAKAGGRVIIECSAKLIPLFERSFPMATVVGAQNPPARETIEGVDGRMIDYQTAAGSLGQFLRPNLASFPKREESGGAYLSADHAREAYWKNRLAELGPGLKVGVSWRSKNTKGERALYCTRLTQWGSILKLPGIHFVNLQYDECEDELLEAEAKFGVTIRRYPEVDMLDDLDETAALMRALDLVISAPTAVSILSAALGAKTWQLYFGVLWQCHGQPNSPWYPAMRNYPRMWNQAPETILRNISADLANLAGVAHAVPEDTAPLPDRCADLAQELLDALHREASATSPSGDACADEPRFTALAALTGSAAGNGFEMRLARAAADVSDTLAQYHLVLAGAYQSIGRLADGLACAKAAVRRLPESWSAHQTLAKLQLGTGDRGGALASLETALRLDPSNIGLRAALAAHLAEDALIRIERREFEPAILPLERSIALSGDVASTHYRLGFAQQMLQRPDAAIAAYRRAVTLQPRYVQAWNNLGNSLQTNGEPVEGIACYRQALALAPQLLGTRSNLLLTLNFAEGVDAETFFGEHVAYGSAVAARVPAADHEHHDRDPGRRLRIGYVSGDFVTHAVPTFIEPILEHHDPDKFEIFCYACGESADATTERLRQQRVVWRNLAGVDDAAAANMVRSDRIDILVDLAGHTALNRLPLFALKPAPVQASYLGYAATTGMKAIDWKILDLPTLPEASPLRGRYVERLQCLPRTMWTFRPAAEAPPVAAAPCKSNGFVTFGSFNGVWKIGPALVKTWAGILARVTGSRMLIATVPEGAARDRLLAGFAERGIGAARIEFAPRLDKLAFLSLYARADIALDTFPCNGGTTTAETLWMGVPLVSLFPEDAASPVSRISGAMLHQAGLAELTAPDAESYADLAVALAQDPGRLAALRQGMRERLQASPLLEHAVTVRELEAAYRAMWHDWCAGGRP